MHGRTRADFYDGTAEYETIRAIKSAIRIPVFANGDINAPQKAREVLDFTGADGVMIGRASHCAPWIFGAINAAIVNGQKEAAFLSGGNSYSALSRTEVRDIILEHLDSLYAFYGEETGVRIARKHLGWYCEQCLPDSAHARCDLMSAASTAAQFAQAGKYFDRWVGEAALVAA